MAIRTLGDLELALQKVVDEVMKESVTESVDEMVKENVQTVVYNAYEPESYIRSKQLLSDTGAKYKGGKIEVTTKREVSGDWGTRDISRVVEYGRGYIWGKDNGRDLDKRIGSRPFMRTTAEELEDGKFRELLQKGLLEKGIKSE